MRHVLLHRYIFIKSINTLQGYQSGQSPPSPRPSPQQLQILKLLSQHMGDKAQQNMVQQNPVSLIYTFAKALQISLPIQHVLTP